MDPASVARRARGENFPVASLLFPRGVRSHLRHVYGYCRLVDILGDEVAGDRLALLDELERVAEAARAPPLRGRSRAAAARRRRVVARGDRRPDRPRGGAVRTRWARGARRARVLRLGRLHAATEAVARTPRARGRRDARAMTTAERAYAEVERLTRQRARNFAYGIMVLPRPKRQAIAAIYAFAREGGD